MGRGILGLVGLAATLAFAVPVGLLGLDMLTRGDTLLGGGFLAVAALMVVLQEYLTTPGDVPERVVDRLVGRVAKEPEGDSGTEAEREGPE
ncbi:hypothetical protein BRC93_11725 [Halobacteriales archaeon QS_5_70_15]|nr:MAG: hypothetical protein BRC93_11725 [Halobacteriales archaeon QS_5_70_15]